MQGNGHLQQPGQVLELLPAALVQLSGGGAHGDALKVLNPRDEGNSKVRRRPITGEVGTQVEMTGRVVDERANAALRNSSASVTVPPLAGNAASPCRAWGLLAELAHAADQGHLHHALDPLVFLLRKTCEHQHKGSEQQSLATLYSHGPIFPFQNCDRLPAASVDPNLET